MARERNERHDYSFLPWAAPGLANRITGPDPDLAGSARADIDVKLTSTAQGLDGTPRQFRCRAQGAACTDLATSSGSTRARSCAPIRATGSRTSSPTTWPRSSSTTRLPVALHPAAPAADSAPAAAVDHAGGPEARRVRAEVRTARPDRCPYIDRHGRRAHQCAAWPDTLWAWAHVHVNRGLTGERRRDRRDRPRRSRRAARRRRPQRNADVAYSRIVCPRQLDAEHGLSRLPGAGLRERPAGRPRARPGAPRRASRQSAWDEQRTGQERVCPSTTAGTSAPGRSATSNTLVRLLKPRAGRQARRHARHGRAAPRRRACRVSMTRDFAGRAAARRRAAGARASLNPDELETVLDQENWAQPSSASVPERARRFHQPRRRLHARSAAQANARPGVSDIARDPDPLITPPLYGRWHALTPRLLGQRRRQPVPHQRQLGARAQSRSALPRAGRLRHARDPGDQESYMDAAWEQIGDVLDGNRRIRSLQARAGNVSLRLAPLAPAADRGRKSRPGRCIDRSGACTRHVRRA